MKHSTDLAPRATIAQLVGIRDRAIARYAALVAEAKSINEMVAGLNEKPYRVPSIQVSTGSDRYGTAQERYRAEVDAGAWDHLLEKTELRNLMSAKQKEEWRRNLEKEPPEFTLETAVATFSDMRANAGTIFRQGLVDVFEALPRDFRSHDGFKLGARCVMEYAVTKCWGDAYRWQHSSYFDKQAQMGDLDRTFHAVAGIPWMSNAADIASAAMQNGDRECETRFFRLRWFKNGNLHVWFLDKETTKAANRLLAEHYGAALGKMHLHPDERRA